MTTRRPGTCDLAMVIVLFEMRDQLVDRLTEDVRNNKEWLLETVAYPLAKG